MARNKILVVDDEENIVELIKMNLERNGFVVIPCYSGLDAIKMAQFHLPDLILLDLMLPDISGLEVCSRMRLTEKIAKCPIIMLTAKSEETDKVIGLGVGADDYITKPFGLRELEARIRAVLRRIEEKHTYNEENSNVLRVKDIVIDLEKHIVKKDENPIDLTLSEFNILRLLAQNYQKVLSRATLLNEITGDKCSTELRTVDVHIRNIRKKLSDLEQAPEYIETIRGVGYKMK